MRSKDARTLPPSLWAATAPAGPDCPPLSGVAETEVAIVGGGFTGLSAALHLAEAGIAATVFEAAEPGWGASGRNGGQINPGWKVLPETVEQRFGPEQGGKIAAMITATCDLVFDLVDRHGIACGAMRPGFVYAACGRRGQNHCVDWVRQWSARGAPVELLDRDAAAALLGTDAYVGGLLDRRGGHLQPLAYARGLARAALDAGAKIHAGSPVLSQGFESGTWHLKTPAGQVRARKLLLCTNGYTDRLWPGLAQCVVPVASVIAATAPLEAAVLERLLPERHAVAEHRRVGLYYRLDAEGRFTIGGRGRVGRPDPGSADELAWLRAAALRLFPALGSARWDFAWGGFVAITTDEMPKLMTLGEGAFAGMGYNGRGVAMATMMGRQLALAVQGEPTDMPLAPPAPIPLHVFRDIAVAGRIHLGRWLDRFEGFAAG